MSRRSRLTREARFQNAYVFKYSPRRDTPAATLPDPVPMPKSLRNATRACSNSSTTSAASTTRRPSARGRQILVEGPSHKNAARLQGRTRCNKIVIFDGAARHLGQLMDVQITHAGNFTLYGDPAVVGLDEKGVMDRWSDGSDSSKTPPLHHSCPVPA